MLPTGRAQGDWVRFTDYATLSAKLAEAERERDKWHSQADWYCETSHRSTKAIWDAIGGPDPSRENGQNLAFRVGELKARVADLEKALAENARNEGRWEDAHRELLNVIMAWLKGPKPCPECANTGYQDKGGARMAIQRTPCSKGCKP